MKTPWKQRTEKPYEQQEKRLASKPGHAAQVNSGRTWSSLRDVRHDSPLGRILIDAKTTDAGSYRITKKDFKKLKRDANRTPPGCVPMLQIDLDEIHLVVMEEGLWDEVIAYIERLEHEQKQA